MVDRERSAYSIANRWRSVYPGNVRHSSRCSYVSSETPASTTDRARKSRARRTVESAMRIRATSRSAAGSLLAPYAVVIIVSTMPAISGRKVHTMALSPPGPSGCRCAPWGGSLRRVDSIYTQPLARRRARARGRSCASETGRGGHCRARVQAQHRRARRAVIPSARPLRRPRARRRPTRHVPPT